MLDKIKSILAKFGLFMVFAISFIVAFLFKKQNKQNNASLEDKKDSVNNQVDAVKDLEIKVKENTSIIKQTINKTENKSVEIKLDKEERDKKANSFFPDL